MTAYLVITALLCYYTNYVCSQTDNQTKLHYIQRILSTDISNVPSEASGETVEIAMEVFLSQMRSVTNNAGDVDYTFYLYQTWRDKRLQWGDRNDSDSYYVVRRNLWNNLWLPDTYIENELKSFMHDISQQNKFIWVTPNGTVVYGIRLTATMSCKFGAMKFPTAYFICRLKFRVHSYEVRDVRLRWFGKSVEFAQDFEGDNIDMVGYRTHNCTLDRSSVIINSCLEVRMLLRKNFGSTILRTYLPSIFIIIVGWLNFWIDRNEVSARVKLGTLVLLAMITEEVGINLVSPMGVIISALDIWFAVLLGYTTLVMIEFAIVHAIDRYQRKLKKLREKREEEAAKKTDETSYCEETINSMEAASGHPDEIGSKKKLYQMQVDEQPLTKGESRFDKLISKVSTGKIEKYCRILYFLSFGAFQAAYWGYYLTHVEVVLD